MVQVDASFFIVHVIVMKRCALFPVLTAVCSLATGTRGSLEGLYILTAPEGQLMQLNWTSGSRVPVGKPLKSSGLQIQSCSPTAIDTTGIHRYTLLGHLCLGSTAGAHTQTPDSRKISGKWIYTLASASNGTTARANDHGLRLVAMQLADGTLHQSQDELPASIFPDATVACDFTIATDGGWDAYVTGVANSRLRSALISLQDWPGSPPPPPKLFLDVAIDSLRLGGAASIPGSTIDADNVLWITLRRGLAGLSLSTKTIDRRVVTPEGKTFHGVLGYDMLYGLLSDDTTGQTVIASFAAGETPSIQQGTIPTRGAVAQNCTSFAFLSDQKRLTYVTTTGDLVTVDLTGSPISTASACIDGVCPAGMCYEPFVF